jgi:hypothetical protein
MTVDTLGFCRSEVSIIFRIARAFVTYFRSPSKGKLGHSAVELLGDLGQLFDPLDLALALVALKTLDLVLEEVLVLGETAVLRDTVVVLSCEHSAVKRRLPEVSNGLV